MGFVFLSCSSHWSDSPQSLRKKHGLSSKDGDAPDKDDELLLSLDKDEHLESLAREEEHFGVAEQPGLFDLDTVHDFFGS